MKEKQAFEIVNRQDRIYKKIFFYSEKEKCEDDNSKSF